VEENDWDGTALVILNAERKRLRMGWALKHERDEHVERSPDLEGSNSSDMAVEEVVSCQDGDEMEFDVEAGGEDTSERDDKSASRMEHISEVEDGSGSDAEEPSMVVVLSSPSLQRIPMDLDSPLKPQYFESRESSPDVPLCSLLKPTIPVNPPANQTATGVSHQPTPCELFLTRDIVVKPASHIHFLESISPTSVLPDHSQASPTRLVPIGPTNICGVEDILTQNEEMGTVHLRDALCAWKRLERCISSDVWSRRTEVGEIDSKKWI